MKDARYRSTTVPAAPAATASAPHRVGTRECVAALRMKEWGFTILSLLSVAMLLWSLNLWEKGYARAACVSAGHVWSLRDGSVVMLGGNDGDLSLHFYTGRDWDRNGTVNDRCEILGVVHNVIRDPTGTYGPAGFVVSRYVAAPAWMPALAFALLPTLWSVRQWKLSTRRARGQCLRCGYDLRASPERCPECGQPAAGAVATPAGGARTS